MLLPNAVEDRPEFLSPTLAIAIDSIHEITQPTPGISLIGSVCWDGAPTAKRARGL